MCATLQFTYVKLYPDEVPIIEVSAYQGIDESEAEELRKFLLQEVMSH